MTDNVQTKFIHADDNVQWVEIFSWVAFLCLYTFIFTIFLCMKNSIDRNSKVEETSHKNLGLCKPPYYGRHIFFFINIHRNFQADMLIPIDMINRKRRVHMTETSLKRIESNPLLICTWILKNQHGKLKFDKLDF